MVMSALTLGMSGVELQQHLSDAGHRIPIIFLTGRPNEATRARHSRWRDWLSQQACGRAQPSGLPQ